MMNSRSVKLSASRSGQELGESLLFALGMFSGTSSTPDLLPLGSAVRKTSLSLQ